MKKFCPYCMKQIKDEYERCIVCGQNVNAENEQHQLVVGTMLRNRFYIGKVLRQGGFGITYIGKDIKMGKKIAIKEFYPKFFCKRTAAYSQNVTATAAEGEDLFRTAKKKFYNEAKILCRFSQEPNIVNVYDIEDEHNTVYMIMDFLEGEDLDQFVVRKGKMAFRDALTMLKPMMRAVSHIHREGLIHRDITPSNIKVQSDRSLVLLDFGAAREYDETGGKSLTVMLKHGYSPIEQYQSHGKQGPWTDVYAVSATLYTMITGMKPQDVRERWDVDRLMPPSKQGAEISSSQEKALLKGLAIFPQERFSSMKQFYLALSGDM